MAACQTNEYRTLRRFFADIKNGITDPAAIADELFSDEVIEEESQYNAIVQDRNVLTTLMSSLLKLIRIQTGERERREKFEMLVRILEKQTPQITCKMKEHYYRE